MQSIERVPRIPSTRKKRKTKWKYSEMEETQESIKQDKFQKYDRLTRKYDNKGEEIKIYKILPIRRPPERSEIFLNFCIKTKQSNCNERTDIPNLIKNQKIKIYSWNINGLRNILEQICPSTMKTPPKLLPEYHQIKFKSGGVDELQNFINKGNNINKYMLKASLNYIRKSRYIMLKRN